MRIALNLKGLSYDYVAVDLLQGEHKSTPYLQRNPQGLVPAVEIDSGELIAQSLAILEWLEETYPEPALLPQDSLDRARVRSVVNNITCDVHPICNLAVTNYLKEHLGAEQPDVIAWYTHWMHRGFRAVFQRWVDRVADEVVTTTGRHGTPDPFRARIIGAAVMGMVDAVTREWVVSPPDVTYRELCDRGYQTLLPLFEAAD